MGLVIDKHQNEMSEKDKEILYEKNKSRLNL